MWKLCAMTSWAAILVLGCIAPVWAGDSGAAAFERGALEQAIERWSKTEREFAQRGQVGPRIQALVQLAHAQAELGQYERAAASLETARTAAQALSDARRLALVTAALGNLYIATGPPERAEEYLRDAIARARALSDPALIAAAANDYGNLLSSQQHYDAALARYRESIAAANEAHQPLTSARAEINAASALREKNEARQAANALDAALALLRTLEPTHEIAFTLVSAGLGYAELRAKLPDEKDRLAIQAGNVLTYAARSAERIEDRRVSSYAWGHLGRLYEDEGRSAEAMDLTRRALFDAQAAGAPESLYRWQWQTGRLLHQLGQPDQAIEWYERAVATLQGIRPELARGYAVRSGTYRDTIGQVYFELVDLLLQRSRGEGGLAQVALDLKQARKTMELYKVAELRDYFRDDCVDTALSKVTQLDEVARSALVVYPILLSDRVELLLSGTEGLRSVVVPVGRDELAREVHAFRSSLETFNTRRYMRHAKQLYRWLIAPMEPELQRIGAKTLVFVPDGPLRTIPMAALHDGERFLIERYALAITPGLDLTDPRPLRVQDAKVLAVGITEPVQGFAPLANVAVELDTLQSLFAGTTTLKNAQFVMANLESRLKTQQYTIVHVASHGEFSSNPNDTFLLAFDKRLSMDTLDRFIGLFKYRDAPLELLTLSACDTAQGDERAALGLAGVAVRAGARSALATLWEVHDEAAADLMKAFYTELRKQNVSRAQALREAQRKVLADPRYNHPGYWSPFLMINNWL